MSDDTDRIPVPTNGKGPHRDTLEAAAEAAPSPPADPGPSGAVPRDQTLAFTPNQLAAGFGIVAGLLLLFAARRRRGRG